MRFRQFKQGFLLIAFAGMLPLVMYSAKGEVISEKRISVAMRMIGHEVLLCLGDHESRVMPIEKIKVPGKANSYRIPFELEFGFEPDNIVTIVDRVMTETGVASHYFVEVEQCDTKEVVYSFEISPTIRPDQVACFGREVPNDCFSLLITLLEGTGPVAASDHPSLKSSETFTANLFKSVFVIMGMLSLVGLLGFLMKKKDPAETDPNLVLVGASQFDKRKRSLLFENNRVELSYKEAELLSLLHTSANTPLEREVILRRVWGDEGAYIGRTLDVFISKLRKKLEADTSVKIENIRGVGYQLVMDVQQ